MLGIPVFLVAHRTDDAYPCPFRLHASGWLIEMDFRTNINSCICPKRG